jgi:hypothetical protein
VIVREKFPPKRKPSARSDEPGPASTKPSLFAAVVFVEAARSWGGHWFVLSGTKLSHHSSAGRSEIRGCHARQLIYVPKPSWTLQNISCKGFVGRDSCGDRERTISRDIKPP